MKNPTSQDGRKPRPFLPTELVLLVLSAALLLLGVVVFSLLPSQVSVANYRVPVISFLSGLVVTAIGNIVVSFIQKRVSHEAARALEEPLQDLRQVVDNLWKTQDFHVEGVVGIYANRNAAMGQFTSEIEREDRAISIVGTSFLGSIEPPDQNEEGSHLQKLLLQKRHNRVKIKALLMHPAYGEFREKVENREKAAVARDIQRSLRFLLATPNVTVLPTNETGKGNTKVIPEPLLGKNDVRLYPGVVTAFAIFTTRAMLVNVSTLHGSVYDNFAIIIHDTDDPNSIYKTFKRHHFELPWQSEKTVRLDQTFSASPTSDVLKHLLEVDFSDESYRFKEGKWGAQSAQMKIPSSSEMSQSA